MILERDPYKRRFLVACPDDDSAVASLWLDDDPTVSAAQNKEIANFYRKHAKHRIREVNGNEMAELIIAGIKKADARSAALSRTGA